MQFKNKLIIQIFLFSIISGCGQSNVTKSEYDSVQNQMSLDQVNKIIGTQGEEMSSTDIGGDGFIPSMSLKIYTWQNNDGTNMTASFQNERLTSKAQFGLK